MRESTMCLHCQAEIECAEVHKLAKAPVSYTQGWPSIWYNNMVMPVHQEVIDLIPKVNCWCFEFQVGNCRMMPVEGPLGMQPGWSLSVKSRHSVTHTIKKRISMKY